MRTREQHHSERAKFTKAHYNPDSKCLKPPDKSILLYLSVYTQVFLQQQLNTNKQFTNLEAWLVLQLLGESSYWWRKRLFFSLPTWLPN